MILYDDKYNFVGMSAHSLSFLGYEDLQEFISMNSDFANLLVEKEGYIYKFENFSWIDFVLYSGSANKSAIVRLKNGQETKIDLTIKEVFLTHPIDGINKFFSIKLISDHFHEISGVPKQKQGLAGELGGFSLGTAVQDVVKEEATLNEEKEAFASMLESQTDQTAQEDQTQSFILDMSKETLAEKPHTPPPLEISESTQPETALSSDDFKLDFFKTDDNADESLLKQESHTSDTLNTFDLPTEDHEDNFIAKEETKQADDFGSFSLLKEEDSPLIERDDAPQEESKHAVPQMNLDFLKIDTEPAQEASKEPEVETTPAPAIEPSFSFLKDESVEEKIEEEVVAEEVSIQKHKIDSEEETTADAFLKFDAMTHTVEEIETPATTQTEEADLAETPEAPLFNLDFLKNENIVPVVEPVQQESEDTEAVAAQKEQIEQSDETLQYKQQDRTQIIEQIKKDIKEIDTVESVAQSGNSDAEKEYEYILDLPQEPQVEQPLSLAKEDTEHEMRDTQKMAEEVNFTETLRFDDAIPNFEIEESKNADANKSFTATLKGLFNKKTEQTPIQIEEEQQLDESENASAFDFKLKLDESVDEVVETKLTTKPNKEFQQVDITPSSMFENIIKNEPTISEPTKPQEASYGFPALKGLGLSAEEEIDLVSDFVSDAKESIVAIEQYIESNDFDKINYSLVKIKSSAEILNLDDIIDISNDMRKHCITENAEEVMTQTQRLKNHIGLLEGQLEATAV